MSVQLLRAADRTPQTWRNGGGVTTEIACEPAGADFDAFGWRISIADVASTGPFSCLTGVDRILCVLDGTLALSVDSAAPMLLTPNVDPFAFAGDAPCHGAPIDGPVRDLNVMVRRGEWHARVARMASTAAFGIPAHASTHARVVTTVLVSTHASATLVVDDRAHAVGAGDALILDGTDAQRAVQVHAIAGVDGHGCSAAR